jgi:aldose 1-epimerase
VPLGAQGSTAECRLTVPAEKRWELVNVLPTGSLLDATGDYDLRPGTAIGATAYDDVYGQLRSRSTQHHCEVADPVNGRRINVDFGPEYRTVVVYTPPHREAVCIEPYTCVPDVFWLADQGHDVGLQVLGPGKSFTTKVEFSAS